MLLYNEYTNFNIDLSSQVLGGPPLAFRFLVSFLKVKGESGLATGFKSVMSLSLDFRFRKVSGIGASIATRTLNEGGQNLYSYKLPERVQFDNLVLERGLVVGSVLVYQFQRAMSALQLQPSYVLVTLLDETGIPISAWCFSGAYPVKWKTSDLDADSNTVVIETMELAYQRMWPVRI